jgi:site-specific DNA-methyltransferase (adenine-specific)
VKLVYQDNLATLYQGSCLDDEGHPWVDADVLITDPPYGMSYVSNSSKRGPSTPVHGDRDAGLRDAALALWGPEKPALVFGTWRVPAPVGNRQTLVWYKGLTPGMGDLSIPWGSSHEEIYVLGGRGKGHWKGKRTTSVIRALQTEGSAVKDHDHPTPKPVALMQELISKTTGRLVADPFAGTGATLVAAKLLGRPSVGVELDPAYIDVIIRRLERVKR